MLGALVPLSVYVVSRGWGGQDWTGYVRPDQSAPVRSNYFCAVYGRTIA